MARLKEKDKSEQQKSTRSKLLDAAAREIALLGYEKANINAISTSAGFAKGTIYNYFDSKQNLMLSLIDETAQAHFIYIQTRISAVEDARDRLDVFFSAGFSFVLEQFFPAKVMLNTIYAPDEQTKMVLFQKYQPIFQLLAEDVLLEGVKQGHFHQMDVQASAQLIMMVYLGTASQINPEGKFQVPPLMVADFVSRSLLKKEIKE